jgi:outer membrane murein-binding lipoprotein Lpp
MKILVLIALLSVSLISCGPESSPEGRMGMKMDKIQQSFDSLKAQNAALADSLHQIRQEISTLKK